MLHPVPTSFLLAIPMLAALSACTSPVADYDRTLERPAPPSDFWISITVLGPERSAGYALLPRAERPARYVVEADRVLRAATGPGVTEQTFPPRLRRLSDEQWARVWDTLRSAGFAHDPGRLAVSTAPTLAQNPEHTVAVISFAAEGVRRALAIDLSGPDADASARSDARKLTDTLADLAWITERAEGPG